PKSFYFSTESSRATWAAAGLSLPCAYTMSFRRRVTSHCSLSSTALLSTALAGALAACAGPNAIKPNADPSRPVATASTPTVVTPRVPVAPSGPPIRSEEDAEHLRRELDTLAD